MKIFKDMKICNECEKKFGILEKIYYTETGEQYCADCVKRRREQKRQDEGQYVELNSASEIPTNQPVQQQVQAQSTISQAQSPSQQIQPQQPQQTSYAQVSIPVDDNPKSGKQWEFRVIKLAEDNATKVTIEKFEKVINRMGEDGWELVSVIPLNTLLMKIGDKREPAMIFKRPKEEDKYSIKY